MKRIFSFIQRAPKRAAAFAVLLVALLALPLHSIAATDVLIEGSMGVANQTTGETEYKKSTNATYDQVVKFQVFYHNRELPDSGRVGKDFKIKIDIPSTAGAAQVVKVTMGGSNTNSITDTATVNTGRADAKIEYIPGSAYWRHNNGTRASVNLVTEKIQDSIILNGLTLEQLQPCHEFEATVTFQARVVIPSVGITKGVRKAGNNVPVVSTLAVMPGDRLQYVVSAKNLSNVALSNVYLRDPLPEGLAFIAGTAKKYYGEYNGTVMSADEANSFFNGKKNIGTLGAGATGFVTYDVTVAPVEKLKCGLNSLLNIAVIATDQTGEYNSKATVTVSRTCDEVVVQTATCTALNVTSLGNRGYSFKVDTNVTNGATIKQYSYDFGDGSQALLTTSATKDYTYTKDGNYTTRVKVTAIVDGKEVVITSDNCAKPVTVSTIENCPIPGKGNLPKNSLDCVEVEKCTVAGKTDLPKNSPDCKSPVVEIPNTGAGNVIGLFMAVSAISALGYRFVLSRRMF